MSQSAQIPTAPSGPVTIVQWCRQNSHFMAVAAILAVVWLGWTIIMIALGMVFHKEAVPWPAGVDVHPSEFRMLSMATSFGPAGRFKLAADGELFFPRSKERFLDSKGEILIGSNGVLVYKNRGGRQIFDGPLSELKYEKNQEPVLDDVPDGEKTIIGEVLESLAIGTPLDYEAYDDRKSTWYVSRTYIDTTKSRSEKYRLWQVDVTYYTGTLDKAPHFPERCLRAAGMILGDMGEIELSVPEAPGSWGSEPVSFRYVEYGNRHRDVANLNVQYYVYSLNGKPESSWKAVRLAMGSVFGKYAYFAKIQFHPLNDIRNAKEAKEATAEFVEYMLPEVLKHLPTQEDIKRLESNPQQAENNSN